MKKREHGFTLIELMVTIAIIGVLAAVAIPYFEHFVKKARLAEMPANLKAISEGSVAWFHDEHNDTQGNPIEHHFPSHLSPTGIDMIGVANNNPTGANCSEGGALFKKNSARWNKQPWIALKFSVNKAHYFRYGFQTQYSGNFAFFYSKAIVDLNCNGNLGMYVLAGYASRYTDDTDQEIQLTPIGRALSTVAGYDDPYESQ